MLYPKESDTLDIIYSWKKNIEISSAIITFPIFTIRYDKL